MKRGDDVIAFIMQADIKHIVSGVRRQNVTLPGNLPGVLLGNGFGDDHIEFVQTRQQGGEIGFLHPCGVDDAVCAVCAASVEVDCVGHGVCPFCGAFAPPVRVYAVYLTHLRESVQPASIQD